MSKHLPERPAVSLVLLLAFIWGHGTPLRLRAEDVFLSGSQTNITAGLRIVPLKKKEAQVPEMPPLAVVERRDASGQTWGIQGSLGGTRLVAEQDFRVCFERQGWRLDKTIPIGGEHQSLFLWRRGESSIILMLHGVGVAKTDFAVGLDSSARQTGQALARNLPSGISQAQKSQEHKQ